MLSALLATPDWRNWPAAWAPLEGEYRVSKPFVKLKFHDFQLKPRLEQALRR